MRWVSTAQVLLRLGHRTLFLSAVGDDDAGLRLVDKLRRLGPGMRVNNHLNFLLTPR